MKKGPVNFLAQRPRGGVTSDAPSLRLNTTLRIFLTLAFLAAAVTAADVVPIGLPGIHHAFRATARVLSGSQPEADAAFTALAGEGVQTIISVDGAKPDVAAARRHGLRYIHLPIGYDGISPIRVSELVKAATESEGRIFVHCHHGQHRGPAAVGVICEAMGEWTPAQAEDWLKTAGTSPDYPGLYRAVREVSAPTPEQLAKLGPLPEVAQTADLVEAMVAIDEQFDALKDAQTAGWKTPSEHPDASPTHRATLLWEQFRELVRTPDTAGRADDYRKHASDSEKAASAILAALRAAPPNTPALDAALKSATQSCAACHEAYRNKK